MDHKKKWQCHVCQKETIWHETVCSNPACGIGFHEAVCEKCRKPTLKSLIHVVKDRSAVGLFEMKSVALYHVPKAYRDGLRVGDWICFRCASPEFSHPVEAPGRSCQYCDARLRASNPKMWCERCHTEKGHDRDCRGGCGNRLDRIEYLYCSDCDARGKRPAEAPKYAKPAPVSGPGMLFTLKPMKPGPGGIKSRNRAGISLIEIEEEVDREIRQRVRRSRDVTRYIDQTLRVIANKEAMAKRCRNEGNPVGALILKGEADAVRRSIVDAQMRAEKMNQDIKALREALAATKEVHTWRMVIPGQFDRPRKPGEVRTSSEKWRPIVPVEQEDIDAVWLDPIRMKPKPAFRPVQDGAYTAPVPERFMEKYRKHFGEKS